MKFGNETIAILKNFALINPSIQFKAGHVISTTSPTETIMASATIPDKIDQTFCIYDLSRLINTLALMSDPTITLDGSTLIITDGKSVVNYRCASADTIILPSKKKLSIPPPEISLSITYSMISALFKAMGVLGLKDVAINGDGTSLSLQAFDSEGQIENKYRIIVGETDKIFNVVFKLDNLKLLPLDYYVEISRKDQHAISKFIGNKYDVQYYIAVDEKSTYQ